MRRFCRCARGHGRTCVLEVSVENQRQVSGIDGQRVWYSKSKAYEHKGAATPSTRATLAPEARLEPRQRRAARTGVALRVSPIALLGMFRRALQGASGARALEQRPQGRGHRSAAATNWQNSTCALCLQCSRPAADQVLCSTRPTGRERCRPFALSRVRCHRGVCWLGLPQCPGSRHLCPTALACHSRLTGQGP